MVEAVGVELLKTLHFKPLGERSISNKVIQRVMKQDEDYIAAVFKEEKELTDPQAQKRRDWVGVEEPKRPIPIDWRDVVFCDEFHLGIGS